MKTALTLGLGALVALSGSSYKASMRGVINGTSHGEAKFGSVQDTNGSAVFTLTLGAYSHQGAVLFSRANPTRPGVGTYEVSEILGYNRDGDGFHAVIVTGSPSRPTGMFLVTTGTITVTGSSDRELTGRFDLEGAGFLAGDPEHDDLPIHITGTFMADGAAPVTPVGAPST